jgi:hypothetical protein
MPSFRSAPQGASPQSMTTTGRKDAESKFLQTLQLWIPGRPGMTIMTLLWIRYNITFSNSRPLILQAK